MNVNARKDGDNINQAQLLPGDLADVLDGTGIVIFAGESGVTFLVARQDGTLMFLTYTRSQLTEFTLLSRTKE